MRNGGNVLAVNQFNNFLNDEKINKQNKGNKTSFESILDLANKTHNDKKYRNKSKDNKIKQNINKETKVNDSKKDNRNIKTSSKNSIKEITKNKTSENEIKKPTKKNDTKMENTKNKTKEEDTKLIVLNEELKRLMLMLDKVLKNKPEKESSINIKLTKKAYNLINEIKKLLQALKSTNDFNNLKIKSNIEIMDNIEDILVMLEKTKEGKQIKLSKENLENIKNDLKNNIYKLNYNIQENEKKNNVTFEKRILNSKDTELIQNNIKNSREKLELKNENNNFNKLVKISTNSTNDSKNIQNLEAQIVTRTNSQILKNTQATIPNQENLNKASVTDKYNLINQIIKQAKVNVNGNESQVKIKLKPDILGEMTLKVTMEKGLATAKAVVESYYVKEVLESNLHQLKESLKEQGVKIETFEVTVGKDTSFSNNNSNNWNMGRNRQFKGKSKIIKEENLYEDAVIIEQEKSNFGLGRIDLII
ncbi:flagellar hook-length control protein FliK [Thermohalobacter berrensis]|uniref:Flagellar hook-length control protein-like C-terminal domain-containing protein n=1 Tax=Thermohalobacter berrensis TaxID=99594 RepID=A0A419TAE2_9FIRM|nr:flagellar hook-length control protein FliK [Thermohalobacter berrensis]RKD34438.1 hypothetical protein BET03_00980 [Thermohalobacter berrensis]